MKIQTTDNYYHWYGCPIDDCERFYCPEHRLLWRFCDTAKSGFEGDSDVVNGTRLIYEQGDCPKCEAEFRHKELYRRMLRTYPKDAICPQCFQRSQASDAIAVHLIDYHEWDSERARLWLRDEIERMGGL